MPFIDLKCINCGFVTEELLKPNGVYPTCPKCGKPLIQNYSGKLYACKKASDSGGNSCGGNCGTCGGCK